MAIIVGKTEGEDALFSGTPNNPQAGARPVGWNVLEPQNLPALVNEAGQLITPSGDALGGGLSPLSLSVEFEPVMIRPSDLGSWTWAWYVDTSKVPSITQPLGRHYVYFSPDHESRSGIHLLYADDRRGPWTLYEDGPDPTNRRIIYEDLDDTAVRPPAQSTETPALVYDPLLGKLRLFYHCINPCYGEGTGALPNLTDPNGARSGCTAYQAAQGTMCAVQVDGDTQGVSFTKDRTFGLDVFWSSGGHGYGDHTGYFRPFQVRGQWYAAHIGGGTNSGSANISMAIGNDLGRWLTPRKQIGRETHWFKYLGYDNTTFRTGAVIETSAGLMRIGVATTPSSGTAVGDRIIVAAPVSDDLQRIVAPPIVLDANPSSGAFAQNLVAEGGQLVGMYMNANEMGVCYVRA